MTINNEKALIAEKKTLPEKVKWLYSTGEIGQQFALQMMSMYMLFFYTNIFGISATAAGTMFLVARIWDAINDPMVGALIDRTKSKYGKCRPYLIFAALPTGVFLAMCFFSPNLSPTMKLVYAYITYIGHGMLYTATSLGYTLLMTRTTSTLQDRVSMNSKKMMGAAIGGILVASQTLNVVKFFGDGGADMGKGFALTGCLYGLILTLAYWFVATLMKKYDLPEVANKKKVNSDKVRDDLKILFKNPIWLTSIISTLCFMTASNIGTITLIYYATYNLGNPDLMSILSPLALVGTIIAAAIVNKLTKKFGKGKVALAGVILTILLRFARLITNDSSIPLLIVLIFITGICIGLYTSLLVPIMMDATVFNEWKHGRRIDGLTLSANNFMFKLALGLSGAFSGYILELSGFHKDLMIQPETALDQIKNLTLVYPSFLFVACVVMLLIYIKHEKRVPAMMRAVQEGRSTEKSFGT